MLFITNFVPRTVLVILLFFIASTVALAGALKAKLIDPAWDGIKIPAGQQCDRFGGKGSTPVIHISGMPKGTEVVVLEFSDRDFSRMNNGGHGKIAMLVDVGALEVTFPSVPGHTFDLPPNIILVMAHKSPGWATAGAYMPPCQCIATWAGI